MGSFFFARKKPKLAKALRVIAFLPLLVFSQPWVADLGLMLWEEPLSIVEDFIPPLETGPQFDAIVVLGGFSSNRTSNFEHLEFNTQAERLLSGIRLHLQGTAPLLVITSGSASFDPNDPSEAVLAGKFALKLGVKPENLILETQSRNTRENATLTLPLLEEKGVSRILLVTSAFHMKRSLAIFKKLDINATPFSSDTLLIKEHFPFLLRPSPDALSLSTLLIKEILGTWVYSFMGWI